MIARMHRRNRYFIAFAALVLTILGGEGMSAASVWAMSEGGLLPVLCLPLLWFVFLVLAGFVWFVYVFRHFFHFEEKR